MLKALSLAQSEINFRSKKTSDEKKKSDRETRILPNTIKTRLEQGTQKTMSAFFDYPVKGLKGDINSNFYEFLTMGIVPYVLGSGAFMFVFNCVNKYLDAKGEKISSNMGKKLALGVVFYGVLKNISKHLVTQPVKAATGVDTEMPYQNIVYNLPKEAGEDANINVQYQQRKIFDSKEFYRKDLLSREYFDGIAKKLGLGENLNDSISETSPIIQNIVATSNLAKSISSYCWAGLGVALANQDSWIKFFDSYKHRKHYSPKENEGMFSKLGGKIKTFGINTYNISKTFVKSLGGATKELWTGKEGHKGFMKHAGKWFIGSTIAITAGLTANTILRAKNLAKNKNIDTIDKTKESTVI